MKKIIAAAALALTSTSAFAHGGGLDQHGCHTNHSTGGYHCHKNTSNSGSTGGDAIAAMIGMFIAAKVIHDVIQDQPADTQLESGLRIAMGGNDIADLYACKREGIKVMVIKGNRDVSVMSMRDYRTVGLYNQQGSTYFGTYGNYTLSFDEVRRTYTMNGSVGQCKFISKIDKNLNEIS